MFFPGYTSAANKTHIQALTYFRHDPRGSLGNVVQRGYSFMEKSSTSLVHKRLYRVELLMINNSNENKNIVDAIHNQYRHSALVYRRSLKPRNVSFCHDPQHS